MPRVGGNGSQSLAPGPPVARLYQTSQLRIYCRLLSKPVLPGLGTTTKQPALLIFGMHRMPSNRRHSFARRQQTFVIGLDVDALQLRRPRPDYRLKPARESIEHGERD